MFISEIYTSSSKGSSFQPAMLVVLPERKQKKNHSCHPVISRPGVAERKTTNQQKYKGLLMNLGNTGVLNPDVLHPHKERYGHVKGLLTKALLRPNFLGIGGVTTLRFP